MTTTTDLMEIINDQYDPNLWSLALTLNVDFDATLKSFADRIGERSPLASCFGLPAEVDAAEAAKGAYWAVVKACKAAYLASISREAAEVIVRALPGDICLTLGRDLQFNANQLIDAWNEAHPDEKKLYIPDEWLLRI